MYVNGPVPELTFTCALPLDPPKQFTLELFAIAIVGPPIVPTLTEAADVHPLPSITVTV